MHFILFSFYFISPCSLHFYFYFALRGPLLTVYSILLCKFQCVYRYFLRGHPRTYPLFAAPPANKLLPASKKLWGRGCFAVWIMNASATKHIQGVVVERSQYRRWEVQCDQVTRNALGSFVGSGMDKCKQHMRLIYMQSISMLP